MHNILFYSYYYHCSYKGGVLCVLQRLRLSFKPDVHTQMLTGNPLIAPYTTVLLRACGAELL